MKNRETDKYVFFLTNEFSQWYHPSDFMSAKSGIRYHCAEQYMMHMKALLFKDHDIAAEILASSSPAEQKALGRKISNFNKEVWDEHARDIVYEGNYYKFTQNHKLFEKLISTKGKLLVEAADYDTVWGVGLSADHPLIDNPVNWRGTNWLGETLTKLRDDLIEQNFDSWFEDLI